MKSRTLILLGVITLVTLLIYGSLKASRILHSQAMASTSVDGITLEPAPDFELKSLDGRAVRLSDFHGKVVVLNFWATWCAPCMALVPQERSLVDRLKGRPFALVGVNGDADKDAAKRVIEKEGMTWRSFWDGG